MVQGGACSEIWGLLTCEWCEVLQTEGLADQLYVNKHGTSIYKGFWRQFTSCKLILWGKHSHEL